MNSTPAPTATTATRTDQTMNGKPVFEVWAKTVINMHSAFLEKRLCDGPTWSTGNGCVYNCAFCYVPNQMRFQAGALGIDHAESVIRRYRALEIMRGQLTTGKKPRPKYDNLNDTRVIFSSPLVDVAANIELAKETAEACALVLTLTAWHIRLLSKSNLLPYIARALEKMELRSELTRELITPAEIRARMIFGVSTGTVDNKLAASFELDTPLVSKRIESIKTLQADGWRTYGMLCPTLPARDYLTQALEFEAAFGKETFDRFEHIWAEVMNVRGENLKDTQACLRAAGYNWQADELGAVAGDNLAWECYARRTFGGYVAAGYDEKKLRFLQYVTPKNLDFWEKAESLGAVLLSKDKITPTTPTA